MDAIRFILNEHQRIRNRFHTLDKTRQSEAAKTKRFKNLCQILVRHETMEEKKWYPHLRKDPKLKIVIKYLISEEKEASQKIKIFKRSKFNIDWTLEFPKFKKAVLTHANDEEKKLFPKVRILLDKTQLQQIGKTLSKFKAEFDKSKK